MHAWQGLNLELAYTDGKILRKGTIQDCNRKYTGIIRDRTATGFILDITTIALYIQV